MADGQTSEPTLAQLRACLSAGRIEEGLAGLEQLRAAGSTDPMLPQTYATALHLAGRNLEAAAAFEVAAAADTGSSVLRQNMVMALLAVDRVEDAIRIGREAVALNRQNMGAWRNLNLALCRAERFDEALKAAETARGINPNDGASWAQSGHILTMLGRFEDAETALRTAIRLDPKGHEGHYNLGVVLQEMSREAEAAREYEIVLAAVPDHKGARINLGVALRNIGRVDEARKVWQQSVLPASEWPELAYNMACAELLAGNWVDSWDGYELRLATLPPSPVTTHSDAPVWDGTPAPGRRLLVIHEQGLGDTIQFARFLPEIAGRVGRVILVCQSRLHGLLSTMPLFQPNAAPGAELVRQGETPPEHDLQISLLSIPRLIGLDHRTLSATAPYIACDGERAQRWGERLAKREATARRPFRIGLSWQGNPKAPVERGRSLPLASFAPLARFGREIAPYALQRGTGAEQAAPGGLDVGRFAEDFDAGTDGFLDTAAVMANLDLVITSDTAVAHVAGALGRPVWLLLKRVPDWRWGLEGGLTPWYPTMRLFRQRTPGDWTGVIAEVERELDALLALRRLPPLPASVNGEALFRQAFEANQQRRYAEAIGDYHKLLSTYPNNGRILNLYAMAQFEAGSRSRAAAEAALASALRSVATASREPDYWSNLAVVLDRLGQREDSKRALTHALAINPRHAPSQLAMANREIAAGDAASALRRADQVMSDNPDFSTALSVRGAALLKLGETAKAELALRQAVHREPDNVRFLVQWGAILAQQEDHKAAAKAWDRALVADPRCADAYSNLGVDERNRGEVGVAFHFLRTAVKVDPNHAEAFSNLGITALEAGKEDEAIAAFRHAIELRPDYADAHMALGMALMNRGHYAEGLPHYEWRLRIEKLGLAKSRPRLPLWQGEDPRGKSFMLVAEQGFGDGFQFARYARVLKQLGASRVVIGCRGKVAALMARMDGVDGVVSEGQSVPPLDYSVFMMSLPLHLGTRVETIPSFPAYLKADPDKVVHWAGRLAKREGFRVGIVWQGNPDPQVDRGRSFPLAAMEPLARIPGVRLIALQRGPGEEQIAALRGKFEVETLGGEFDNGPDAFADTAAVMMNLDLVITSDTAVAHLAGALGRPTWVVLRANPEWRWLRGRSDSPWYPSTRLFRRVEGEAEDAPFEGVMSRVSGALASLVAGNRAELYRTELPDVAVAPKLSLEARFKAALADHVKGNALAACHEYAELLIDHPRLAEAFHMLGAAALGEFNYNRALILMREADAVGLKTSEFRTNYAIALRHTGRQAEAEALLRRTLEDRPTAEALMTLGNLVRDDGKFEEAVDLYRRSIELRPELSKAHRGLGNALKDLNRCEESLAAFEAACKLTPSDPELLLDQAHALLLAGRYGEGFEKYEVRWRAMEMLPRHFDVPRWHGEDYRGRTLLVHGEQGIGDQIQFARYLPLAARLGGRMLVEVRAPLVDLVRRMDFGATPVEVVEQGRRLPAHDLEVPMMSLPAVFHSELDSLPPPPDFNVDGLRINAWRQSLGGRGKLRVGLIWQGNPKARADVGRSPPLSALAPLFELDGLHFISLQHRDGMDQLRGFPYADRIEVVAERLGGFAETAAAMRAMDVIVSSCTSSAHLAGSLGMPTFIMLRSNADWRWLTDRNDSPWYPTVRLFRQTSYGDWGPVVAAVKAALADKVKRS
ncbi:tetratricopeptide repeat protein [Oryzibacter oryziterrae]|uniref:tetratricopeptide repeat protein n=1 Tax=Oryzibacter oryziterrae TaxID=2766474 RepID=UPI001F385710|nr:tetratricopeptide repeat protein [Oryzibacter oryziterrae]